MPLVPQELRDVAPGLWIWRLEHPEWRAGLDWPPAVTSTCVESGGEVALLAPLAPPEDAAEVGARLDARPPTMVVVLKPDHVRDTDLFVRRYGARAYGPYLFWRTDIPETELELIAPDGQLRIWATPWHEERALPALRKLLELPFEHVIVAHGEPVHDRAAYERALELPPFG